MNHIDEKIGMSESTAYALLAYVEARRKQVLFYVLGFFSGVAATFLISKLLGFM